MAKGFREKSAQYRAVVKNQRDEVVALFRGTAYKTKNEHTK